MSVDERVEAGTKILFRIVLLALGLWFLYLIRDVVLLMFLAVLTSAALSPAIARLKSFGLSRTAAVALSYSVLFFGIVTILALLVPVFLDEMRDFISKWPVYTEHFGKTLALIEQYLSPLGIEFHKEALFVDLEQGTSETFQGIFSTTISFFSGIISVLGFFFLALYLSLEEKGIEKFFLLLTPERYHRYALSLAERMSGKVSQWLFGQLLLMIIVFVIYYIGLSLLGIPYALAIAFFGGLMEIIPYVGPIIAGFPAVIMGLLISPVMGFSVLAFYVIAHQLEGHIIAPQVLKRSIGLNPVVLILVVLIGAKLGGPLGILIAVPATMMLSVLVEDFINKKEVLSHE
jgi:predicted PurR-regulated permease PerM